MDNVNSYIGIIGSTSAYLFDNMVSLTIQSNGVSNVDDFNDGAGDGNRNGRRCWPWWCRWPSTFYKIKLCLNVVWLEWMTLVFPYRFYTSDLLRFERFGQKGQKFLLFYTNHM